ncbi:hypothetical protein [Streptomyces zagrosensis]|uniref:asparaginase n=1 Tax=Streptomyces zagrosensis TaxID=1042984 RepID=A0A7W9QG67_9ACTN|nr:hypothetical protein [Streptomyces zagrosensis]MBB5939429.1 hypothetical protein [Streptomyces zagrosensis]
MRGLIKAAPSKTVLFTGGTVAAFAAAAGLVLAGCNTASDGVRKEGEAKRETVSRDSAAPSTSTTSSAAPSPAKVDPVALIKADPKVDKDLKRDLKPCGKDEYPVEVSYGKLTGASVADVVVNVMTCADGFGIGSYVYRKVGKDYTNVFLSEQAPVFTDIEKNELRVTQQVYDAGDALCCPSGEDVIHYRWSGQRFAESGRTHTDFSKTVDDDDLPSDDDGTEG